jgi:hypothetical protein
MTTDDMVLEALEAELHRAERRAEQAEGRAREAVRLGTKNGLENERLRARAEKAESSVATYERFAAGKFAEAEARAEQAEADVQRWLNEAQAERARAEQAEAALRLHHANVWKSCAVCDLPIGALAATTPGEPRTHYLQTRHEGVNGRGEPYVEVVDTPIPTTPGEPRDE